VAKIECVDSRENYGRFIAEPLEKGLGITLGNALRRVLLGYLTGAAITRVNIESILHEFSTIPHIKEDTIEFLLNVKTVRLKALSERPGKLTLTKEGEGPVYAGDITPSADFEIVNPELYLATLNSPEAKLNVEFDVELGTGYQSAGSNDNLPIGTIPLDAVFTPTRKVNYNIKPVHIGRETSREQLQLEIWTDGTISPEEALSESAKILSEQLSPFIEFPQVSRMKTEEEQRRLKIPDEQYNMPVEQLDLSVRTMNCLRRAGITTVGELVSKGQKELLSLRNFGLKSKQELEERLAILDLSLSMASDEEAEVDEADETPQTTELTTEPESENTTPGTETETEVPASDAAEETAKEPPADPTLPEKEVGEAEPLNGIK
jgi:DNA-directed RNA polymerase subunit alpha